MKKIIYLISFFCLLSAVKFSSAQWLPDIKLTNVPSSVMTYGKNIAARNNFIHVVWTDSRHTDLEIYYKRSTDGGLNWDADSRFTTHAGISIDPQIAVYISSVHVVWQDDRDGNSEIYYKRSTDDGITWDPVTRLTTNPAYSASPVIAVTGLYVYTAWCDGRNSNDKIFFKRSTDGGLNWGNDIQISNGNTAAYYPSIFSFAGEVYITWEDLRFGNNEIFFKRSTDGGNNWGPETRLTNNTANSIHSSVTVANQLVNVFWEDDRNGQTEIYYKRSTDDGTQWSADTRLTNSSVGAQRVQSIISGQILHIVYEDYNNGTSEIAYSYSTNSGLNWLSSSYITPPGGTGFCYNPSIAFTGSSIHVAWRENRTGPYQDMYYRQNPNGNVTGISNINSEIPEKFSLSQNYPNPFNPSTKINFSIPAAGDNANSPVKLAVYDILGRESAVLVNEDISPGNYSINFNASDLSGGVYFYRLSAGEFTDTKKLILVK